jgi:hypothetical protein
MAALLLAVPSVASASTASSNPSMTDGTVFTGAVGTITEDCESNVIIFVQSGRSGGVDPDATTYDCTVLKPTATITWGDGTAATTATLVAQNEQVIEQQSEPGSKPALGPVLGQPCNDDATSASSTCTFTVEAGTANPHTYARPGSYSGHWSWSDSFGSASGSQPFTATVTNGAMTFTGVHVQRSGNNATLVGTFTYANATAHYCDFTVSIDWGDGTTSAGGLGQTFVDPACTSESQNDGASAGHDIALSPAADPTKSWSIGGTHTYANDAAPSQDVSVTVTHLYTSTVQNDPIPASQTLGSIPAHPSVVTTDGVSLDAQTSATVNGFVDPQESTVSECHFDWGLTTNYGNSAPCTPATFSDPEAVSSALSGLSPNTTYHYRVVVTTGVGTATGNDQTFQTLPTPPPGAPSVSTGSASSVATKGATLNGSVNPVGGTLSDCHFEYGTTTSYGSSVACSQLGISGHSNVSVSAAVTGLNGGTLYHYKLVAANPNTAASDGADATFTTLPDCDVVATVNFASASGCLVDDNGVYTSTPGTAVGLNGMTLQPGATGFITIDTNAGTIKGAGTIRITASHGTGSAPPIFIYEGTLNWTIAKPNRGVLAEAITTLSLPPESNGTNGTIDGLPIDGDIAMSFTSAKGATFTGNAWLPLPVWLQQAIGVTGTLQFQTKLNTGISADTETIQKDSWSIFGAIGVKNLKVTYDPVTDSWSGSATVLIPTPQQLTIGASLAVKNGEFHSFGASVSGLNIPIGTAIELQSISFQFGVKPTTFGGSLGLSFGPQVSGKAVATVTGGFVYQAAYNGQPGLIQVTGALTVGWLKGLNAYFDDYTDGGGIRFGANISPGSNSYVTFNLSMDGAMQGSKFDLDGKANISLKYINVSAGAEILISDVGFVGCAHLSAFGFGWSPGIGYTWSSGDWDLMAHGCSVGPWQTLTLGQGASAAAAPHAVRLLNGSDLVELDGAAGSPKVTLTGPHGQHISVPVGSTDPLMVHGFQVLQDPSGNRTWIAIQHGGGTWKITPEPGSTAVTGVRGAQILPPPRISAKVATKGDKRLLSWHLAATPGQKVVFWETGKGVAKIIGSTTKSHGTLQFVPAPGPAGKRTIEAHVTLSGEPRANLAVAHFKAAAPPKPAKTKKITVTGTSGGLNVSWAPAANVAEYLIRVQVTKGDGAKFIQQVKAPAHRVNIADANPIKAATVSIVGESVTGVPGVAATSKYAASKPKKKKPKH